MCRVLLRRTECDAVQLSVLIRDSSDTIPIPPDGAGTAAGDLKTPTLAGRWKICNQRLHIFHRPARISVMARSQRVHSWKGWNSVQPAPDTPGCPQPTYGGD
ncbi:hypothetical protein ACJJTC_002823 [Scirpophaga incertulas]